MTRSTVQLIILAGLGVILIVVSARVAGVRRGSPGAAEVVAVAIPPAPFVEPAREDPPPSLEPSPERIAQREHASGQGWGRDPFIVQTPVVVERPTFTLSGILWDPQKPIAIINGSLVRIGEELSGYRVVAISHDRVSLIKDGHTLLLEMGQ
jgi:hypothetical protein